MREQIIIKKGSQMKSSTFSLFAQVLGLIDRRKFDALASEHAVEKSSKGFGSWLQFVAMLFAQLSALQKTPPRLAFARHDDSNQGRQEHQTPRDDATPTRV